MVCKATSVTGSFLQIEAFQDLASYCSVAEECLIEVISCGVDGNICSDGWITVFPELWLAYARLGCKSKLKSKTQI